MYMENYTYPYLELLTLKLKYSPFTPWNTYLNLQITACITKRIEEKWEPKFPLLSRYKCKCNLRIVL